MGTFDEIIKRNQEALGDVEVSAPPVVEDPTPPVRREPQFKLPSQQKSRGAPPHLVIGSMILFGGGALLYIYLRWM